MKERLCNIDQRSSFRPPQERAFNEQQKTMVELREELNYYKERNEQMAKVSRN